VLYRRFFEGRKYQEIADEIGVLPSRVHEIGQEGLRKLGAHVDGPPALRIVEPVPAAGAEPTEEAARVLSEREQAVLAAAAEGLSAEETATRAGRSVETIKAQRRAVIRKLGAVNIMNAIHIAHRLGVLA
jgi:DNA-binding CsgD family transcriptional regulator